jgi:hypothetical protein
MLTIIKPRPETRGSIRVFDVIQVDNAGHKTRTTQLAHTAAEISRTLGLSAGSKKVYA